MIKNQGNQGDTELMILKGEMVVFHGDLFHSGAAYVNENRRIYFKAIPRGCKLYKREKILSQWAIVAKKLMEVAEKNLIPGNSYTIIIHLVRNGRHREKTKSKEKLKHNQ